MPEQFGLALSLSVHYMVWDTFQPRTQGPVIPGNYNFLLPPYSECLGTITFSFHLMM